MNHKVGIWIDHKKAVIVFASADQVTTKTVESNVGPHARYASQSEYPTAGGPQAGRGEKSFDGRFRERLHRYYDEVIHELGQPEALLILGPGEAKQEFKERLSHMKALDERVVGVETSDKLTDAQLVAHVKEHYGLARREGPPTAT